MTANPEQPVLDEIAELVRWQIEEGERRGDHLPEDGDDGREMSEAESELTAEAFMRLAELMPTLVEGFAEALDRLAATADTLPRLTASIAHSLSSSDQKVER